MRASKLILTVGCHTPMELQASTPAGVTGQTLKPASSWPVSKLLDIYRG